MREGLSPRPLLAILLLFGMAISAQDFVDYLNGIAYVFPSTQGGSDQILTNDGTGGLTWSDAPTPEGLWSGSRVFSTVSCPTGWTRVSAMDDRVLRGSGASGGTGGSDTHVHGTLSGVTGSTAPSVTGSSAGSSVSISGSTSETSISHGHGVTPTGTAQVGGFPPAMGAWTSVTINSSDPGHSHGVGTLTGGSHTHGAGTLALSSHGHGTGTLAAASASSLAAYYGLIVCQKD